MRSGQLGREQAMAATRRLMSGGSDTAENFLDQGEPAMIGPTLIGTGHVVAGLRTLGDFLARKSARLNERGASAVGNVLMSNDPEKIRSIADLFANAQRIASQPSISPAVAAAGFGVPRQRSNDRRALNSTR